MSGPSRLFVDFSILISAALSKNSSFRLLWELPGIEVLFSQYTIDEAGRHLHQPEVRASLWHLLYKSHLVPSGESILLPPPILLPEKDKPVLQSAIAGEAHPFVTGDRNHFGAMFGVTVLRVLIESTSAFKSRYPEYFNRERPR